MFGDFFTSHTCCILDTQISATNVGQTFKKMIPTKIPEEQGSSPSSIVLLLLMHMQYAPTQMLHINTLTRLPGPACSCRWYWPRNPFFYRCTLIMIYSFRAGDQWTTQALSQLEEKVVGAEKEWEVTSCGVHWQLLTVPLSSIGS